MKIHEKIFECTVGSRLHNTHTKDSDTDRRIIFRDSLYDAVSPFYGTLEAYTSQYSDTTYYELRHFARMLAKRNPTAIEIAYGVDQKGLRANRDMIRHMADLAMDTEKYVSQCNGMMMGMLKRATPKRLHHAARIHAHLTNYVKSGIIEFNAATYHNYSYLMALKRGEVVFDMPMDFEKVEVERIWDTQDLDKLNDLVVDCYMEDISL